jgi:hypothetical protein
MSKNAKNSGRQKSSAQRKICLPVIKSLRIEGYPLYPGEKKSGTLDRVLSSDGVTVIAGINGQGKTTLLNILYRVLVGPWDQTKSDFQNPGKKQHELTKIKKFNYFSSRIGRSAEPYNATLLLQVGDEEVSITRNLGPSLGIVSLMRGKTKLVDADDERWLDLMLELTGMPTQYDFHFVVRNFLFFLEDKVPLLWNPYGQFEILRILFLPEKLARDCAETHDFILRKDSLYRNNRWQLGQFKDRLDVLRQQYGSDAEIAALIDNLVSTQVRYESLSKQEEEIGKDITRLYGEIKDNETAIFKEEMRLHDIFSELQAIESNYLSRAFPNAQKTAELVYSELLLNRPCIICGQDHHSARERLQRLLKDRVCPACETPFSTNENLIDVAAFDQSRLRKAEMETAKQKIIIAELRHQQKSLRTELGTQQKLLNETAIELLPIEAAVKRAQNAKNSVPHAIQTLQDEYLELEATNKLAWKELLVAREKYEKSLKMASDEVEKIAQHICDKFKEYADQFLHQVAALSYDLHERTVGESGQQLFFPNFVVKIRSEVVSDFLARPDSDQVSESQREFVDLAFRMALLDTAVSQYGPAMLVVETPEASLDAVFIERAGKMLRQFAGASKGNRLIATCNVNGENMIGWLLGTADIPKKSVNRAQVDKRVINLLKEGLPTAGYRAEPAKYDAAYEKALYGS